MIYKTSLDKFAKAVTIGVTLLFATIIVIQYSTIRVSGGILPILTTMALLVIYLVAFAWRPINYEVTTDNLTIYRLISNVKIELSHIKSVELVDKEKTGKSIRIFGVGGLFGYYGKFANHEMGNMTWYATRRDKTVLVKTVDNKQIILTPDEPAKFVANFAG